MRYLLIPALLAVLLSSAAFADTTYAPGANGGEARGASQYTAGNWIPGGAIDGWDFVPAPATGPVVFDVQGDVTIWEKDLWNASQFYFHFGDTSATPSVSVEIDGTVESNSPVNVQVYTTPGCDIKVLKNGAATMPLLWEYWDSGTSSWATMNYHGADINRVVAYPSYLPAGLNLCKLQATATASATQAAGHYVLDPIVACVPAILD